MSHPRPQLPRRGAPSPQTALPLAVETLWNLLEASPFDAAAALAHALLQGAVVLADGDARGVVRRRREADGLPDGLDLRGRDLQVDVEDRDVDLELGQQPTEQLQTFPLLRRLVHLESQAVVVHVLLHRRLGHAVLQRALLLLGHARFRPLPPIVKNRALEQAEVLHL